MLDATDNGSARGHRSKAMTVATGGTDVYFSADVETDGPIPGPFSMLSFGLVRCGTFDGAKFEPEDLSVGFYRELQPISKKFQSEALLVNGLDRDKLIHEGHEPSRAMNEAHEWIMQNSHGLNPVLVAYPLSFDWTWLFWYFTEFCKNGSPFNYSRCYDLKTAIAVKGRIPISQAGRSKIPKDLQSTSEHTHNALDDAIEQAEIFMKSYDWQG